MRLTHFDIALKVLWFSFPIHYKSNFSKLKCWVFWKQGCLCWQGVPFVSHENQLQNKYSHSIWITSWREQNKTVKLERKSFLVYSLKFLTKTMYAHLCIPVCLILMTSSVSLKPTSIIKALKFPLLIYAVDIIISIIHNTLKHMPVSSIHIRKAH